MTPQRLLRRECGFEGALEPIPLRERKRRHQCRQALKTRCTRPAVQRSKLYGRVHCGSGIAALLLKAVQPASAAIVSAGSAARRARHLSSIALRGAGQHRLARAAAAAASNGSSGGRLRRCPVLPSSSMACAQQTSALPPG
jgi:hypothetical protein